MATSTSTPTARLTPGLHTSTSPSMASLTPGLSSSKSHRWPASALGFFIFVIAIVDSLSSRSLLRCCRDHHFIVVIADHYHCQPHCRLPASAGLPSRQPRRLRPASALGFSSSLRSLSLRGYARSISLLRTCGYARFLSLSFDDAWLHTLSLSLDDIRTLSLVYFRHVVTYALSLSLDDIRTLSLARVVMYAFSCLFSTRSYIRSSYC